MEDVRVAAVCMRSELGKPHDNIARMDRLVREAANDGASIVCFPEACISGYAVRRDIIDYSDTVPGWAVEETVLMAASCRITILAGLIECDRRGNLYLTQFVATPEGLKGIYRKLHLGPPEIELYQPGHETPIFRGGDVSFGIELCYDGHFPELSTILALKGADVLFIPHASPNESPREKLDRWLRYLPARAYDNSVYVVACNQVGENGAGLNFPGVAMVMDPKGRVLISRCEDTETLAVANLEGNEIERIRAKPLAYFLGQRRPEIYRERLK
jgi:N-carbamoylputrescine amidase